MSLRTVLLLGATGLVGRSLLSYLLREPSVLSVLAVLRRDVELARDPKLRPLIVDFESLERHSAAFRVDCVFCALGTTMRNAGTRDRFRRVDHDYPVTAARLARAQGASHYLLVSAFGANPSSSVFYNRVKGETEDDISHLGFASVTIARPSLLLGPRTERRIGERMAQAIAWLAPPSVRPIPAHDVAAALTLAARESRPGIRILASRDMRGASSRLSNY